VSPVSVLRLPVVAYRHRELLWSFVHRDLKARYEGSLFGRLWPLLNPLILFGLYYWVFVEILQMKMESRGLVAFSDEALMGLYIVAGILPWTGFADSLNRSTTVVLENGNLVKKIAFPSELLPLYAVLVNTIYFLLGLLVFIAIRMVFFDGLPSQWPFLLLAIPLQVLFSLGLGLALAALNIFVRDTAQILPLVMQLWFFATPIVYHTSLIEKNIPNLAPLMKFNPMYHLVELYHAGLVLEAPTAPWVSAQVFSLFAVLAFIVGYTFFLATKGRFADEL
jgi:ABC-type polysaccharide/polyol phosphate export permease